MKNDDEHNFSVKIGNYIMKSYLSNTFGNSSIHVSNKDEVCTSYRLLNNVQHDEDSVALELSLWFVSTLLK